MRPCKADSVAPGLLRFHSCGPPVLSLRGHLAFERCKLRTDNLQPCNSRAKDAIDQIPHVPLWSSHGVPRSSLNLTMDARQIASGSHGRVSESLAGISRTQPRLNFCSRLIQAMPQAPRAGLCAWLSPLEFILISLSRRLGSASAIWDCRLNIPSPVTWK